MADRLTNRDNGSKAAWIARLEAAHGAALGIYLRSRWPHDAEDLQQEVWARALVSYEDVSQPEELRHRRWLFTVGKRLGIDKIERKRRPERINALQETLIEDTCSQNALEDLVDSERAEKLSRCLRRHAEAVALLQLKHLEGLTNAEIAERLGGITLVAATKRIQAARQQIRTCMETCQ